MKFLVILFCFMSTLTFAQRGKKQTSIDAQNQMQAAALVKPTDADQILQIVLSDFSLQLASVSAKPTTVILLDSYSYLVNKRFSLNDIQFISGGKADVLANSGIVTAFWRFDISETTAHIEFYYTDSKNQTTHHEYKLIKENAVWRK